ncbi:MAG: SRPBCC domain-containing protein [bacterium]
MKTLKTEIEIKASPEKIWAILTDFAAYPDWNPFIRRLQGKVQEGARLEVLIEPPGGKGMVFKPTVRKVFKNKAFHWVGHLLIPGIFDGEHIFTINENTDGSVTFVQQENFRGLLVPLVWGSMADKTKNGFSAMNLALKQRAEGLN